jgi:hypothetical protein
VTITYLSKSSAGLKPAIPHLFKSPTNASLPQNYAFAEPGKKKHKQTNRGRLLQSLLTCQPVDRTSAVALLDIFDLSRHIRRLIAEGYPIKKKKKSVNNKNGRKVWIAEYRIDPQ